MGPRQNSRPECARTGAPTEGPCSESGGPALGRRLGRTPFARASEELCAVAYRSPPPLDPSHTLLRVWQRD